MQRDLSYVKNTKEMLEKKYFTSNDTNMNWAHNVTDTKQALLPLRYGEKAFSPSPLRRGLFVSYGGWGEGKKGARKMMREAPAFSLLPPSNFLVFHYLYLNTQWEPLRRREARSWAFATRYVAGVLHTVRISNSDSVQRGGELETITERVFEWYFQLEVLMFSYLVVKRRWLQRMSWRGWRQNWDVRDSSLERWSWPE